jgi:hypothetical protein
MSTSTSSNSQENLFPKILWSEGQIIAAQFRLKSDATFPCTSVQCDDRRFLENQQYPPRLSKHHLIVYYKAQEQGFTCKGRHCCWWLVPWTLG